ncbi:LysM peptidoglycan-binding domain-containing protein, partial [Candidatus Gracilibacteria bacterium]|nr:LysM peptidoglycan-binding domain-containing protein [Candidatus Gracilibacteria bacterium]
MAIPSPDVALSSAVSPDFAARARVALRVVRSRWLVHSLVTLLALAVVVLDNMPPPSPRFAAASAVVAPRNDASQTLTFVAAPRAPAVAALIAPVPLAPALQTPRPLNDLFLYHRVAAGETLTSIAAYYAADLATLVSVNRLENGDVLMVDQDLRIPRFRGASHVVAVDEQLVDIAQRFDLSIDLIRSLPANRLSVERPLLVGEELILPGATPSLGAETLAALAERTAQPAGLVRENETNLR